MTIEYHPAVEHELLEIRDFYERRVPGLGREFIDEFERQVLRIVASQERWMVVTGDLRRAMMKRFPYLFSATQSKPHPYHSCKTSAPTSGFWTSPAIAPKLLLPCKSHLPSRAAG
jgi:hypothetical protein